MATRKWKSEFIVNTTTAETQRNSVVTALADGGFVIAWLNDTAAVNGDAVFFQRYDALGNKLGLETAIPQASNFGSDYIPAITTLSDGRFYIARPELFVPFGDTDIMGTVFNPDGTVSYDLAASQLILDNDTEATVAGLAGGATVTVYRDASLNGGDILFRVFNSLGVPGSALSFTANTNPGTLANLQNQPQVAANAAGDKFAVVWGDTGLNAGDIRVRVFDYDSVTNVATEYKSEFAVNSIVDDAQTAPDIAFLDNNRFVVAWQTYATSVSHGDGSITAIKYAIYDIDGTMLLGERLANTTVAYEQFTPQIASLSNGNFVIAWTDASGIGVDSSGASIKLQAFNSVGDKIGGEITVNTTTTNIQESVSLAALNDGRVVVTWTDNSDGTGDIRAQIVDPRDGIVDGTSGADRLYGHDAIGDIMSGGAGEDTLLGLDGSDQLYGGEDGDFLNGGLGTDTMDGGAGMDIYIVDNANDVIVERAGVSVGDSVYSTVSYVLNAGVAVESLAAAPGSGAINLTGNGFAQNLIGNSLNNTLDGGADALQDSLTGGAGNDTYIIRSGNDLIFESGGQGTADRVRVTVSFALAADDNIEFLETLVPTGVGGINLTGNGIAQTITGNNGANIIRGAGGIDQLRGNLGNDSFHYALQSEGNDKVLDFSSNAVGNNDRFTFLNGNFNNVGLGVLQAPEFQSGVSNVALAAGVRFFYETDTHILRYDSNGSGAGGASVIATLQASATFVIGDILII